MKKLLKVGLIAVVLVVVLLACGVFWVVGNINGLAKKGIEAGGTFALGVPTTVQSVSLHPFAGELGISGLNVANPQGFVSPHFLSLGKGDVTVGLGSLRSDVIEVPDFLLSGIDVNLERKAGSANYKVIMDNLGKLKSGGSSAPASSGGTQKKLIIKNLELSGINVHLDLLGVSGGVGAALDSATKINIPIDHVRLSNVGQTGSGVQGSGVTIEQLTSIIMQAVLTAATEKGGGLIPADVLGDLKGGLGSLGGLASIPMSVIGKPGDAATKIGETVQSFGDQGKKSIEDARKKIGDGLGDLLPGKKDEPKKK